MLADAGLPPAQAMAGMNAVAATVRGLVGMAVDCGEAAEVCAGGDFLGADFEFGIRALVRGLVLSAPDESADQKLPTTSGPPRS